MHKVFVAAALAVPLVACGPADRPGDSGNAGATDEAGRMAGSAAAPSELAFASDDERIIYALGLVLGENIGEFSLTEAELDIVAAGMRDVIGDREYRVDLNTYGPQIEGLIIRREQTAGAEFAEQVAAEPAAERTASGLVYVPLTTGDGEMPAATDRVLVHYTGTLRDGSVFDSSVERGVPAPFVLNEVIPCWTEGVQMMRVGGTAKLVCPSDIAYGDRGSPPVIPPGATLMFEVELLDIVAEEQ